MRSHLRTKGGKGTRGQKVTLLKDKRRDGEPKGEGDVYYSLEIRDAWYR
jgi:hypothetical protein